MKAGIFSGKNLSVRLGIKTLEDIKQVSDGGFIITGISDGATYCDAFVIKLDCVGNVQWYYDYGGDGDDGANCIVQTLLDGGSYICGGNNIFW